MDPETRLTRHFQRNALMRQLHARPRLFISVGLMLGSLLVLPHDVARHLTTRLLIAWNLGIGFYLVMAALMIHHATPERMRWRARIQDEGRYVVLGAVVCSCIACIAAIVAQLILIHDLQGTARYLHILLAILTIASAWAFVHLIFALHYAHDYYRDRGSSGNPGLEFPGTENPTYGDFLYFAAVIGTSGQTADVSFTSSHLRRIGLYHCVLAYAFNTTILALAINIASGLL